MSVTATDRRVRAPARAATGFAGFPREAITFFAQLAKHNEREWFQAHREVYERACREPMERLVAELGGLGGAFRIMRINRDLRFSRDKSPYHRWIAAHVNGMYLQLSTDGLYVGTGIYRPDPKLLARLRAAIADDASGRELAKLVASLRRRGYEIETHETLSRPPRGFPADHPRIELLRMKDLVAGRSFAPEPWLSTPRALTKIRKTIRDIEPFREWIRAYVRA